MSGDITDRSTERVRALRERLSAEYGDFRVVEKTWRHPPHFYDDLVERFEDGTAGGAGAWVYDDDGRVLLVREAGATDWGDPGGKRQGGESFEATAKRVVSDRTGADVSLTGVLELHAVDVYDGTDPERPTLVEPIVVFEARYEGGEVGPGPGIDAVEWFTEHPPATRYENPDERPIPYEA